jgi:TP901 family phage tail tape measure protein
MSDKRMQLLLELKDKALAPLRGIQAGSQDAAKALADARVQLKQLNAQQAALGSFEKSTAAMRESSTQLKVLRQNLQTLQATGQGSTTQAKQLQAAIEKQTTRFKDQQTKVLELRSSLTRLGITNVSQAQQRLGTDIASTTAKIDAQKNALKQLGDQNKRLDALKSQHAKAMVHTGMAAGAGVAMVAAGRSMARPVQATLGEYSVQENASTQLSASMMLADGSVSKEFKALDQLAKRLGDRLPGTTADFLELMAVLKQQGLGDGTILGGTGEAAALLGVQLRMNIPAAGEFAAKMQDATRTAEKDMMGLMDTIQRSYYMGVDSNNMLQGFSKMSPVMSILNKEGLEFSNMMAPLLVMMDQTGMAGESAGNAIRKVFQGGLNTKKLEKANELLKSSKAGFQLKFTDKGGAFLGMDNVFAQLEKLKGLGNNAVLRTGVMQALFGDDSETLQVLNSMMDKGMSGYQEVADKMAAQASLQQRVDQQLGTLTNVMDAAQGGFTNVMASIGETVQGDAKGVISWIGDVTGSLGAWVKEHPVLTANIVRTVAVLAALTAGLGMLMIPLALIYGKVMLVRFAFGLLGLKLPSLMAGIRGVAGVTGRLAPLLARAAPMLLRMLGPIGLLATAGWSVYSNWEAICGGAKALWQDLGEWWSGFSVRMAGILSGMWGAVTSTAKGVLSGMVDGVRGLLDGGVDAWMTALLNFSPFGVLWNAITATLSALGIQVPEQFRNFGGFIVDGLIGGINGKLSALKDAVLGAASSAASWFKERLGIASPSKLFTQFGGWISEGAANGIEAGQAHVRAAALAMAGAATVGMPTFAAAADVQPVAIDRRPALAAPGAARPAPIVQGDTIAIHIHATPGMDERAIAQIVQAELQRNERAKVARLQNAFNDFG